MNEENMVRLNSIRRVTLTVTTSYRWGRPAPPRSLTVSHRPSDHYRTIGRADRLHHAPSLCPSDLQTQGEERSEHRDVGGREECRHLTCKTKDSQEREELREKSEREKEIERRGRWRERGRKKEEKWR
ncbi:hypothetical protein DPEC_G00154970 [Dallia pectoralis]|uniref:Uncharacterized protein n=1 Tax=Dallia pectoralis TaxID=75939 RepID=A0ACC2GKU5_DALPE|nr:hypothetical protein DPEC_G00154970 [Dallia pectoralis]